MLENIDGYQVTRLARDSRDLDYQVLLRRIAPDTYAKHLSDCPSILVMTRTNDPEVDALSVALADKGVALHRVNCDVPDSHRLQAPIDPLAEPPHALAWWRHFSFHAFSVESGEDFLLSVHRRQSWMAVAWSMGELAAAVMNRTREEAWSKLFQLRLADESGFIVPKTLLATDSAAVASLGEADRVVKKVLGPHFVEDPQGILTAFPPSVATDHGSGIPALYQEFIESEEEIRAYVVADNVICLRIDQPDINARWNDSQNVSVTNYEMPDETKGSLLSYARKSGIDICAIDLLRTDNGYVFLECNILCDWRWYEERLGSTPVTESVSALIASRAHENGDV